MGVCPSVMKRYEGVGGVTSALRNVFFFKLTLLGFLASDADFKIIWLPFPIICSCA